MAHAHGEIDCDSHHLYAYISIGVVFVLSVFGCVFPRVLGDHLEKDFMVFLRGLSPGLILSVSMIHCLAEGVEALSEQDWPEYPWGDAVAILGIFFTFLVGTFAPHSHAPPENELHFSPLLDQNDYDEDFKKPPHPDVVMRLFFLAFGLTFHSFFVGFAIGLSNSVSLFIAIVSHQLFEGISLGFKLQEAKSSKKLFMGMVFTFAFSCPIGTLVGLGVVSSLCDNPHIYEIISGLTNCFTAGILLVVSLSFMIAEDLDSLRHKKRSLTLVYLSGVFLGIVMMASLGFWV